MFVLPLKTLCRDDRLSISEHFTFRQLDYITKIHLRRKCNLQVWILCNDCNDTTEVYFHIIGQKCSHCKSYNTRTIAPPVLPQWWDDGFPWCVFSQLGVVKSLQPPEHKTERGDLWLHSQSFSILFLDTWIDSVSLHLWFKRTPAFCILSIRKLFRDDHSSSNLWSSNPVSWFVGY